MRSIKFIANNIQEALVFRRTLEGPLTQQEIKRYMDCSDCAEGVYECELPAQVHEILVRERQIKNPVITHCAAEAQEVSRMDWVYRMEFHVSQNMDQYLLKCRGLDTIVDVYLNGKMIGSHRDMFYPFQAELAPKVGERNILLFHFHSPIRYLENMTRIHGDGPISPAHYMRKAPHDFEDFLGMKPYFALVGIFDHVVIEEYKNGKIEDLTVSYELNEELRKAVIKLHTYGKLFGTNKSSIHYVIKDPFGKIVYEVKKTVSGKNCFENTVETDEIPVSLWWPNGYGGQPMYSCEAYLESVDLQSAIKKGIGFRKIEFQGDFKLFVNNIPVRMWGANLVPINGLTHCFDRERAETLIKRSKGANMNILRLWGGGEPYPDELYTMADRAGLMIWGEFFHKWGMYPEEEKYMELYRKESIYMLQTFRHHPALILWCGGNESHMGAKLDYPSQNYIGEKIFLEYARLCKEMDPEKQFLYDSPFGGDFTNDPREGDFHGWNHLWYVPYDRYPVMFSENSRVSPPILKNLKKYISDPEKLWPKGFQSRLTRYEDSLLPPAWMELKTGPEPYWCSPVEQFYDADTPEELVYRCQAAHGQLMKRTGERLKRGRPAWDKEGTTRCQGQLIWKLNDSWPQIFCSLLDYDLDGGIPYYTIKRAFEPIQVSFDIDEHITIWVVNDSRYTFRGAMEFILFDPTSNKIMKKFNQKIETFCGHSDIIMDLDILAQFERKNIMYVCLKDEEENVVARNYEFVEIERNLYFPDAKLTLERDGNGLIISTDQFARCIKLEGLCGDESNKFLFEDNYFDLMPFEKRRIEIQNTVKSFTVQAKAFYATKSSSIQFK